MADAKLKVHGREGRELRQRLADERQIRVDSRGPAHRAYQRQAGLEQHPGDGIAVQLQLGGDSADAPAFGMVVAQYLRFNFWGKDQGVFSGWNGIGEYDSAESPDARIPAAPDGRSGSARAAMTWISSLSVRLPVEQAAAVAGNPDASLSAVGPGIDAGVRHGRDGHDARLDSDCRQSALTGDAPAERIPRRSSGCRDHNSCRSARGRGSRRTGSVFRGYPLALRANGESTATCAS